MKVRLQFPGLQTFCTNSGNNHNWDFVGIVAGLITWDGSESTDWDTAGNWDYDTVPTATHEVIIANAGATPQLGSDVSIASIANRPTPIATKIRGEKATIPVI